MDLVANIIRYFNRLQDIITDVVATTFIRHINRCCN